MLPFVFTTAVVLFLYRVLPSPRPKTREIWPGAIVAAALISLVRGALELYFEHLADLGALYGSLGALMALLIFVYAVSLVLVFGAEYASEWSRLPKTTMQRFAQVCARSRYRGWVRPHRSSDNPPSSGRGHSEADPPSPNNPGLAAPSPPGGAVSC